MSTASNGQTRPLLTIFATPKRFQGHIGVIQRNAIASWTHLKPKPEIILFGTDEGTAEIARGFGVKARHVRDKSEVVEALAEMIAHPGPYVLDVMIPYQEHVLPMIPAGMTVRDIIKG